jgi:hypothetical protein
LYARAAAAIAPPEMLALADFPWLSAGYEKTLGRAGSGTTFAELPRDIRFDWEVSYEAS